MPDDPMDISTMTLTIVCATAEELRSIHKIMQSNQDAQYIFRMPEDDSDLDALKWYDCENDVNLPDMEEFFTTMSRQFPNVLFIVEMWANKPGLSGRSDYQNGQRRTYLR